MAMGYIRIYLFEKAMDLRDLEVVLAKYIYRHVSLSAYINT